MSLNRIVLVGHLTRDPELKYSLKGDPVATLGIAVNRFSKNDQGDYEVDFFNIVAFRKTAQFASDYLRKGNLVSVDGRLQSRSWVDQPTGQKRTVYEVVADSVQSLGRRSDGEPTPDADMGGAPSEARGSVPARAPAPSPRAAAPPADAIDESDPFADE